MVKKDMPTDSKRADSKQANGLPGGSVAKPVVNQSILSFSDSPFLDDDSWAQAPRAADRRLQIAAVVLAFGVVALTFFAFGARIGKSRAAASATPPGAFGARGAGGFGGIGGASGGFGGRARSFLPTTGKVTKIDGNTITLSTADGAVVMVNLADDTSIGRRKIQRAKDISVGDEISVRGVTGDDGSISATAATLGDLEPSLVPSGASAAASGGIGGLGGGAVSPIQPGDGLTSLTRTAGSVVATPTNDTLSSTTLPSLGGLLPG
jgi:hypothetical protein